MKVAISTDHRGVHIADFLISQLKHMNAEVIDLRVSKSCHDLADYPDAADQVCIAIGQNKADFGVLICGTGVGTSIAANKHPGIRAALVWDDVMAAQCRRHVNANVLCLAGDMISERNLAMILHAWLDAEFEGGRHQRRVEKIMSIENSQHNQATHKTNPGVIENETYA